jgi:hypothetical protein
VIVLQLPRIETSIALYNKSARAMTLRFSVMLCGVWFEFQKKKTCAPVLAGNVKNTKVSLCIHHKSAKFDIQTHLVDALKGLKLIL